MAIIKDIAEATGLPSLVIETGFLVIIVTIILILIFVGEAVFKIKKEMTKFNTGINYILRLLVRKTENFKISQGYYDFKPEQWRNDTDQIIAEMLRQGKSYDEIVEKVDVTRSYISHIEEETLRGKLIKK